MKKYFFWVVATLILSGQNIYSQNGLRIGMTADEFKEVIPGVIPAEIKINKNLQLKEKLHSIDGAWSFAIYENTLRSATYTGDAMIKNETDFKTWIISAESVISDYTKIFGQPVKHEKGSNKFAERNNYEYEKTIGKREVFLEATWETNSVRIKISCDFRSNYYEEFREDLPNGPVGWYKYSFQIVYSFISDIAEDKPEKFDRFYLGMNVNDFVKAFPALFPNGLALTGQWGRDEEIHGLSGGWAYNFENGKLNWMLYDKYIDQINKANFTKCLSATRQIIKDYTSAYGKADTTIIGDTTFVDPVNKRHWGYDVIEVRWKNFNGMKIKVEFTFMGGKGDYHFLVKMTWFDKNYPYYD
jgi:hypothetical protein